YRASGAADREEAEEREGGREREDRRGPRRGDRGGERRGGERRGPLVEMKASSPAPVAEAAPQGQAGEGETSAE
ncbi:MAG TPA: hypothetical protein VLQ93_21850, partial [Myxococcaceae bacterium]|nr:hypothetical protein [Myxococcaceae bacterium]